MKSVRKVSEYRFGWTDPRVFKEWVKPPPTYKRLVGDTETGMINEYTNRYIHGVTKDNEG